MPISLPNSQCQGAFVTLICLQEEPQPCTDPLLTLTLMLAQLQKFLVADSIFSGQFIISPYSFSAFLFTFLGLKKIYNVLFLHGVKLVVQFAPFTCKDTTNTCWIWGREVFWSLFLFLASVASDFWASPKTSLWEENTKNFPNVSTSGRNVTFQ